MENRQIILISAILLATGIVFWGDGVGISIETLNGVYSLGIFCDPTVLISFLLFVFSYIYAIRGHVSFRADRFSVPTINRRFVCFIIDFIVVLEIIVVPSTIMALTINGWQTGEFAWTIVRPYREDTDWIYPVLIFVMCFGSLVMFGYPVSKGRRSVGGVITRFYIGSEVKLSIIKSTLRSIVGFLTLCAGIFSLPWAWASKDKKFWHDDAFNTFPVLLDIEKQQASK